MLPVYGRNVRMTSVLDWGHGGIVEMLTCERRQVSCLPFLAHTRESACEGRRHELCEASDEHIEEVRDRIIP